MTGQSEHLDAEACRAKAAECRALAWMTGEQSQRIMLEHMADTWERIAKTYETGAGHFQ
jgi:hypothetical protein